MTGARPSTCSKRSRPGTSCSPTAPMTATLYATRWLNAAHGPTSAPCPTGTKHSHSVHGSTGNETRSSASSLYAKTAEPWPDHTTSATTMSSHPYNPPQSAYGCELIGRSPGAEGGPEAYWSGRRESTPYG